MRGGKMIRGRAVVRLLIGGAMALVFTALAAFAEEKAAGNGSGPPPVSIPEGKSYALVIGNSKYHNKKTWREIPGAARDAEAVAKALSDIHKFEVETRSDLSGFAMQKAVLNFLKLKGVDPNARLLIWFAGHGTTIKDVHGNEQGFLVPVDAPESEESPDLELKSLRVELIRDWIAQYVAANHVMVVFDSCFAGSVFEARRTRSGPFKAVKASPPERWKNPVRHFIAAGTARQTVNDDGNFARVFIEAISGRGRLPVKAEHFLTGSDLGNYLHDEISALPTTQQRPLHRKFPAVGQYEQEGEFVFELPFQRTAWSSPQSLMLTPSPAKSGLETFAERCLYGRRHLEASEIAREIAALADPKRNAIVHRFDPYQVEPTTGGIALSTPHEVHTVTVLDGQVRIRYSDNGQMILIPIDAADQSAADDSGNYLLRGAWRRATGYGCVEFSINVRTKTGRGKVFNGLRARWREGLPFGKKPLTSTLTILPDK